MSVESILDRIRKCKNPRCGETYIPIGRDDGYCDTCEAPPDDELTKPKKESHDA